MRPTTRIDLADPGFVADPYPVLAAERARHPVAWHEQTERWLTFDHATASTALRHRALGRLWSDLEPRAVMEPFNLLHRHQMMEAEPPDHARLRQPVAAAFHRGGIDRLRPVVRRLATRLLDGVDPGGFDVIADYAEPLPVLVIAALLGVPADRVGDLRRWSQAIVAMYEPTRSEAVVAAALAAATEFAAYVADLADLRRRTPADDLLSRLAAADLAPEEVVASVVLLLNAGHEASVNAFGNGLVAMLEAGQRPAADVALTVEELLRHDSALHLFERTATADLALGDVTVAAGEKVAVLLGAANRDPAVFEAPDEFRPARNPNPHLAFGAGTHFCLGSPLARLELAEALELLCVRFPDLRLAGPRESRGTFVLRGYRAVWVDARVTAGQEH